MDVIKKKHWWQSDALKWSVLGLLGLLVGYLVVLMYAQGEYLFAITTLILSSAGLYIFANRKAYAWRWEYNVQEGKEDDVGNIVHKYEPIPDRKSVV